MGMGGSDGCRNDTFSYGDGVKVYIYMCIYIYTMEQHYYITLHTLPTGSRGMELL